MKTYYIHVPGWVYAMEQWGENERDARKRFRERQCLGRRLPKGTAVWEKS